MTRDDPGLGEMTTTDTPGLASAWLAGLLVLVAFTAGADAPPRCSDPVSPFVSRQTERMAPVEEALRDMLAHD